MADVSSQNATEQVLDRLRGQMPASECGLTLASLIFLRWVDFEEAEREAIAAFDDVIYEPVLPAQFRWRSWCDVREPRKLEQLFRELSSALGSFANSPHNAMATQLYRVASAVEKISHVPSDALAQLIDWLAQQPFETPADHRAMRDLLDSVLINTYDKVVGRFVTPIHIAALMVAMARPRFGESVYDPCFGSGGLLTAALDDVEHRKYELPGNSRYSSGKQPLHLAGVEINPEAYLIGLTRLVLSGVNDPQIELGNSLERVPSTNPSSEGFDIVLANPPWGMKLDIYGKERYSIPTTDSSSLFLQHALSQLRPGGRAIVVVPPSLLFRRGRELELRRWLLENHAVDAIVSIPRGAFTPHTSIDTCVLMVRRGGGTKSIRMVNGEALFPNPLPSPNRFGSGFAHLRGFWSDYVLSAEPSREWWDVDARDIAEIDYDLTPKRRDRSGLDLILESLPKEVRVMPLKDCCTVLTGRNIRSNDLIQAPPKSNYEPSGQTLFSDVERGGIDPQRPFEFADTPIPYIRIGDVSKGEATRGSSWLMPAVASTIESKWKLRAGDILLSKSGTIGKAGIVRNGAVGAIAASGFFVLRCQEGMIDPHYLLAYVQNSEANAWLDDRARGSAAKHLSLSAVEELPVAVPPLQIQQRTAEQHRKFGVDALTYLAELLSEDESQSLASELNDWVSRHLKIVESYEGDLASRNVLELLEDIAESECPISICRDCRHPYHLDYTTHYLNSPENYSAGIRTHCLACWLGVGPGSDTIESLSEQSPLVAWALDFSKATEPLSGVLKISRYGLLKLISPFIALEFDTEFALVVDRRSGKVPRGPIQRPFGIAPPCCRDLVVGIRPVVSFKLKFNDLARLKERDLRWKYCGQWRVKSESDVSERNTSLVFDG